MVRDAFLCSPGFEEALVREAGADADVPVPGVVVAARPGPDLAGADHLFARQVLPDAVEVRAPSVSKLANGALDALLPRLDDDERPWRLDVLVPDAPLDPNQPGELARRAALVGDAFGAAVKKRRRRVARRRDDADARAVLVQLLLLARETLLASAAAPEPLPRGGLWPSPFPGGVAAVTEDEAAPSSAYRKLEEAFLWLGVGIEAGDRVADLGAAPGGWTHVALRRGAKSVEAVDRAALDARIAADPRVTHHRRTAFSFEPATPPCDWLLSDVIAFPERSLELLTRWVREGWARNLVFHLKFRGREDYGPAERARRMLLASDFREVRAKHLRHDRNEITLLAAGAGGRA